MQVDRASAAASTSIRWAGLIVIFGIYYAPYVYMFTASALRNMDPALEEAAEVSGASALRILFTVTFPLIAPAIISGMLLSFIVMLGIYGIPAVLGAPGDIPVLTTYIFKLTNWSPPLYSTAAVGRDHPDGRHRLPGLAAAAVVSRARATSRSPARRSAPA